MRRRLIRGHNLLEMIIACMLFVSVTTSLVMVWVYHSRTMEKSGGRLVGQFLAHQLMEECLAAGHEAVGTLTGPQQPILLTERVRGVEKTVEYFPEITVSGATVDGEVMRQVRVRVEWYESGGRGSVEYSSLLAPVGGP